MGTAFAATEGESSSGTLADIHDVDSTATFSATVDWGDGTTPDTGATFLSDGNGGYYLQDTHTYAEEGTNSPFITIQDSDGNSTQVQTTATVQDAPLTATGTAVTTAVEGEPFSGQVASFTDANPDAPLSDFLASNVTIHWGDGSTSAATTITQPGGTGTPFKVFGQHTYIEDGPTANPLQVTITDRGGAVSNTTGYTPTVLDAPLTATATAVTTAVEGEPFSGQVASFTDANPAAPLSDFLPSNVTIHWGDGSTSAATAITQPGGTGTAFEVFGQHPYAEDGPTANPLQVTITDIGGAVSNTTSYTPAVADAPLTATGDFTVNAVEGVLSAPQTVATFTDANPGDHSADMTATINWGGAGSGSSSGTISYNASSGVYTVQGSFAYAEENDSNNPSYPISVTITDDGGSTATATSQAVVADAPLTPAGTAMQLSPAAAFQGIVAQFSDADSGGSLGNYTATVDWGDGTPLDNSALIESNGNGGFDVIASHPYAQAKAYTVTVTVQDRGGSFAQVQSFVQPTVQFATSTVLVDEEANPILPAVLTVKLDWPSTQPVTVHYQTSDGTAYAETDYVATSGTLTFAPGQTWATISVPTLDDGGTGEGNQGYNVTLSNPTGAVLGIQATDLVVILDSDGPSNSGGSDCLHFVQQAGNTVAGQSFSSPLTIEALTPSGSVDTSFNSAITLSLSSALAGGTLAGTTTVYASAGIAQFPGLSVDSAGTWWLDASAGGSLGAVSQPFDVAPAAATQLLESAPANVTAGVSFSLTVFAADPFGNVASGFTGTVQLSSSDALAGLPSAYTFQSGDHGVHTFTGLELKTAGSQTVTATDTADSLSAPDSVAVDPAAATHFAVSAPSSVDPGVSFSLTVTAYDSFGNVATGYSGTVYFTSTDADSHVALPSDYTFLGSDQGTRSFSGVVLQTPGSRTITATDTADYLITGHAAMSVTAVVTHFLVVGPDYGLAGVPFTVTVEAMDASDNCGALHWHGPFHQ